MRLLLDTHILIWAAAEPQKLSGKTRSLLADPNTELTFSVVSLWEIAIKLGHTGGRHPINVDRLAAQSVAAGYLGLEIKVSHALAIQHLPLWHRDPFDRMLIAQARVEGLSLLTVDHRVIQYGGNIVKA